MIDSLSMAVHAFVSCVSMSLSVGETLLHNCLEIISIWSEYMKSFNYEQNIGILDII